MGLLARRVICCEVKCEVASAELQVRQLHKVYDHVLDRK